MAERPLSGTGQNGEEEQQQGGIRISFVSPELLRAYILDPKKLIRPRTLAERLSHVRETPLGAFSLDGQLFEGAKFTLLVEADPDPRGKRSTAIIRTDLKLGDKDSAIKRFKQAKADNETSEESVWDRIRDRFNDDNNLLRTTNGDNDISLVGWSENIARIYPNLESLDKEEGVEQLRFVPLTTLQLWDRDDDPSSISVSLFSYGRYNQDWLERRRTLEREEKDGWSVDPADAIDRWDFEQRVGVDVFHEKEFNESTRFFEESFSRILSALYKSEGVPLPHLQYEIEPPLIFQENEVVIFEDIGGQENAVVRLKALAELEKNNTKVVTQGRSVLLEGPPGNGKSSLVEALSNELKAPLVKKTSLDLPRGTALDMIGLFEAWHLEAKSVAKRSGGKAVYCIEGLEVFLQNPMLHDMFLNILERWENDPEVLFITTTNFPDNLHEGIRNRFTELQILPPKRNGIKKILEIHAAKIAKILGHDAFANVDLDKVAQKIEAGKNVSGREIVKFLGGAYSLGKLKSQTVDTDFILSLLPDQRLGFRLPQ